MGVIQSIGKWFWHRRLELDSAQYEPARQLADEKAEITLGQSYDPDGNGISPRMEMAT